MQTVTHYKIPFNRAATTGKELEYLSQALANGHISGNGTFTQKCETWLQGQLGVQRAILTTSCTSALEMAALLLNIQPDDEVIMPSFTYVSTANAFVLRGARPVFIDVKRDTLNLDEDRLAELITPRTKAIVAVHYAGVGCEMTAIQAVATQHGLAVVEDNAHGLFGRYAGQPLGAIGDLATLSFHETKNITCGEGGALLINDERLVERALLLRDKGTNRQKFFRGLIDRYTWVEIGSSFSPSELLAAFLYAQLCASDEIQTRRRHLWQRYHRELGEWAEMNGVQLPYVPPNCEQSYHLYYLLMPSAAQRARLLEHLERHGILAVFHYQPLHLSKMGRRFGGKPGDCPTTEEISDRIVRLPFYTDMSQTEQAEVIERILEFKTID